MYGNEWHECAGAALFEKYTVVKFFTEEVLYSNACKFRNFPCLETFFLFLFWLCYEYRNEVRNQTSIHRVLILCSVFFEVQDNYLEHRGSITHLKLFSPPTFSLPQSLCIDRNNWGAYNSPRNNWVVLFGVFNIAEGR